MSRLLQGVVTSFHAFTQELPDGPRTALVFEARIRDCLVQGVSLLEDDEHGLIKTITVMPRSLSGLTARGDAVRAERNFALVPSLGSRDRAITPARAAAGRPPRRNDRPTDPSQP